MHTFVAIAGSLAAPLFALTAQAVPLPSEAGGAFIGGLFLGIFIERYLPRGRRS